MKNNKDYFYTDINMINLPIFSSSKKLKKYNNEETHIIEDNNSKTLLKIKYPGKSLSVFDRKIMSTIEYIAYHSFDFNKLNKELDQIIIKEEKQYRKERNLTDDKYTTAHEQFVIMNSIKKLSLNNILTVSYQDINNILLQYSKKNTNFKTKIKKSLVNMSNTYIYKESEYYIDKSKLEYPNIPLLDVAFIEDSYKHVINISLNPFHLYNFIKKRYTKSDLKMLLKFKNTIATRLYELLKSKMFAINKYNKSTYKTTYEFLTRYMQVKKWTSISKIRQQLNPSFQELIDNNIIVGAEIKKGLYDYDIYFHANYTYYQTFYNNLNSYDQKEIKLKLTDLNNEDLDEINSKLIKLEKKLNYKKDEKDLILNYYRYFIVYNDYM